jgi:acyl dehydratase
MTPTYDSVMALTRRDVPFSYTERDSMLYALAVGMGRSPTHAEELRFVFEKDGLKTVPSQAGVVARTMLLADAGLNRTKILHGEQKLTLHRPLPSAASLLADSKVNAIHDKGKEKGAVIYWETVARDANSGEAIFTVEAGIFARGDGGIGSTPGVPSPEPHATPSRAPDHTVTTRTREDQALLYRLTGDMNPLHADPQLAESAGFKAPILHGMCTYGIACKDIVATVCNYDSAALRSFDVRFTSPVYPGESITTDIWVDGNTVSFRCRVKERDVIVLNNGRASLRAKG